MQKLQFVSRLTKMEDKKKNNKRLYIEIPKDMREQLIKMYKDEPLKVSVSIESIL